MTDEEWQVMPPFRPPRGRKRAVDLCAAINAICCLFQLNCQWGLLQKDFPLKSTVDHDLKWFSRDGAWARIHDAVCCRTRRLEDGEDSASYAIIDIQLVKTSADGRVGFDAGMKAKGRSRHFLVDTLDLVLKTGVGSASIQDRDGGTLVFDKLAPRFPFIEKICGDGAYRGPSAQGVCPAPLRIVERAFARLRFKRDPAKDLERFSCISLNFIQTAMIKLMARRLAKFSYC